MISRMPVCPPTLCHLSMFCFQTMTCVNVSGFLPNLLYILILWRSGLGLLMGKFRQLLIEVSVHLMSVFSFLDSNLSKYQWICTKHGMVH